MKTETRKKETSTLTIENFIDSSEVNKTDPKRIERGETTDSSMHKDH